MKEKSLLFWVTQDFLNMTSKERSNVGGKQIDKLDLIKMKDLWSLKDAIKRMKKTSHSQDQIFVKHIADKVLVSRR